MHTRTVSIEHSSNRPAWLRARRSGVSASEVPGIMGLSPYDTPLSVYVTKVGAPEDSEPTEAQRWGTLMEPLVLAEYARRRGVRLGGGSNGEGCFAGTLLHNPAVPHLLATPDEVQDAGDAVPFPGIGLVECKTTAPVWRDGRKVDPYEDGEVPIYVLAQVQAQLLVTGLAWATVVWLKLPERTMHWQDVEAHAGFQAEIAKAVERFWRHVEEQDPPEATWTAHEVEAVRALYPADTGARIAFDDAQTALALAWERLGKDAGALKKQREELGAALRLHLRDAPAAALTDGRVLKAPVGTTTTTCEACGHRKTSEPYRTLRIVKGAAK